MIHPTSTKAPSGVSVLRKILDNLIVMSLI